MDFLDKHTVLVLNSLYQCIGTLTPKKALIALNSSSDDNNVVARCIDVVYKKNEDGSFNIDELDYWQPLTFEEWLLVEPRKNIDEIVRTPKLQIRCPSVIVTNYSKMPMRRARLSKSLLYKMQDGRCGYTNEKIAMHRGNLEHKVPRSKKGKDTFENLMFVKQEINSKRGNRPLEELGLVPIFSHKTPKPTPACYMIKSILHPDWFWFVNQ